MISFFDEKNNLIHIKISWFFHNNWWKYYVLFWLGSLNNFAFLMANELEGMIKTTQKFTESTPKPLSVEYLHHKIDER